MGDVILVHGAWHGAWCWDGVVTELRSRDVATSAVELPFTGFEDDVAAARSVIAAAGPDVVVCAHSYGGVVVNQAALDCTNVGHIVHIAALITTGDPSVLLRTPMRLADGIISAGEYCSFDPSLAHEVFYGDSDASVVADIGPRLRPMVLETAMIIGPDLRQPSIPSTYVVCGGDQAIPPEAQYAMAERSATVIEWPTDHSPFLTRPGDIADLLARAAGQAGLQPNSLPTTETNDNISPG